LVSTLREEHRLRVFENRVLRRIFGFKWEEVEGGWRRPHNEELHNLCNSPNVVRVIKEDEMSGARSIYERVEKFIQILVGEVES
jgi:hypothetical protein